MSRAERYASVGGQSPACTLLRTVDGSEASHVPAATLTVSAGPPPGALASRVNATSVPSALAAARPGKDPVAPLRTPVAADHRTSAEPASLEGSAQTNTTRPSIRIRGRAPVVYVNTVVGAPPARATTDTAPVT